MHILLTNDDGPPDARASPYLRHFIQHILKSRPDWHLTICVPDQQRSWIGKAIFVGRDVHARFAYMSRDASDDVMVGPYLQPQRSVHGSCLPCITNKGIAPDAVELCLVDGTPATATDVGLHHLTTNKFDLVISGPNVGRNSSAAYMTSSGTIGAAMEAVITAGVRSVALSWAYFDGVKYVEDHILKSASEQSCRVIEHLRENWNSDTQLYNINVPLLESLSADTKAIYTHVLENQWCSVYSRGFDADASKTTRAEDQFADVDSENKGITFTWQPDFIKQREAIFASPEDSKNDGRAIEAGLISVTPLRAVFHQVQGLFGELTLKEPKKLGRLSEAPVDEKIASQNAGYLLLTLPSSEYIYQPLTSAINNRLPNVQIVKSHPKNAKGLKVLHYGDYEHIDMDKLVSDGTYFANTYVYRKALIRKHFLAHTIHSYIVKNPESALSKAYLETFTIDVDYAEFLDDALDENWELRQELEAEDKWWILKPSMSDKAQGIRVFKTIEDLQAVFDSFDEEPTDDEGEANPNSIITSQLRHFIVQEYMTNPFLMPSLQNRKFHIRCYVTCVGDLEVYVYDRMLALFAPEAFNSLTDDYNATDSKHLACHLTNTCLQENKDTKESTVYELDALEDLSPSDRLKIKSQIHEISRELFLAAVTTNRMNFQPLPNAFETYGLDFLVDSFLNVKILEVNAYPDFKQTGNELKGLIDELFDELTKNCIVPLFQEEKAEFEASSFVRVLDHQSHEW
ncbi:LAME_0F03158g1_1 [Lachancea meyersii CBS 8951]|uniref:LAME_0F03158g1_1 n=1 Tax=Lachancea meyersii CBS 8951 TaxID=1266667 RepID=A0A1G4JR15_9SACH|nr:LAME_0F03158g1_1 [Lachancea meyersii CBS 8951]